MPTYWLRRPELSTRREVVTAFDLLVEQSVTHGPRRPIEYRLEVAGNRPGHIYRSTCAQVGLLLQSDPSVGYRP